MEKPINQHEAYLAQVKHLATLYKMGTAPGYLLNRLNECIREYQNPEYRSHFLYMVSEVLVELNQKEDAYRIFAKIEQLFPNTLYSRVAADVSKQVFPDSGGTYRPIPNFVPSLQVEPTNVCNIDCIMCPRNSERPLGYMDFSLFQKIVDEALAAGVIGFRLYHMGEPLLHKKIGSFVKYFKNQADIMGFNLPVVPRRIGIQTNGLLLDENFAETLMIAGIDDIAFSIDGRSPEEFEKIRRKAKFETVIRNLRTARNIRDACRFPTQLSVSILDMGLNNKDKERLHFFYTESGADQIGFNPCSPAAGRAVIDENGNIISSEKRLAEKSILSEKESNPQQNRVYPHHVLDRMVVLWNGDMKCSCGEPSKADIIGNAHNIYLKEAYDIKMRNLGLI